MNKTLRKVLSMVCAITMVVATMTGLQLTNVVADTTTTTIKTDATERTALLGEIANADYNFALGKTASVSQLTTTDGGTNLGIITNGTFSTENNKNNTIIEIGRGNSSDNAWVQVDLGAAYDTSKIDRVAVQYKTNGSCPRSGYTISYSVNGFEFVTVATVGSNTGSNNQIFLDEIALTEEQALAIPYARYIRVTSTNIADTSNYGMQVKGMAVLTDGTVKVSEVETKEIEKLDDPKSVTVTSSDYQQLEYVFEAAEGHEDYTYYAYIDNAMVSEAVVPGQQYVVSNLSSSEHVIKIISYKEGLVSDGIEGSVVVKGYDGLLTDVRNIAVGKKATASSVRNEDLQNNTAEDLQIRITDGDVKSLFRTDINEASSNIVVDLEKDYSKDALERVVMSFNNARRPKDYSVECSADGVTYAEVAVVTGVDADITSAKIDTSAYELETIRYVKVIMNNQNTNNTGYQIYELAIIENYIDIDSATVTYESSYKYTGAAIEPDVTVEYDGSTLVADQDYVVSYGENTAIGEGTITVSGIGRFTGTSEKTFTIEKQDVANVSVNYYFDEDNELVVDLTNAEVKLTVDVDYTYVIGTDEDGNITITATGIGDNYTGEQVKTILLEEVPVNEAVDLVVTSPDLNQISVEFANADKLGADSQTYDIYIDEEIVGEDVEAGAYTYDEQTVGTHTVKVVADLAGNQSEGVSADVDVAGMDISTENATVVAEEIAPIYTGSAIEIGIEVTYGEDVLVKDVDYTVEFSDNINAGTAKYKVTGIGLYQGTVEGEFTIVQKSMDPESMSVEASFNESKELVLVVGDGEVTLVEGVDYNYTSVTDEEYNVTITITGLGANYNGEITLTIPADKNPNKPEPTTEAPTTVAPTTQAPTTVAPSGGNEKPSAGTSTSVAKVKKVKAKKLNAKKVKVTWKKIADANGYEVRYGASKKFKKVTVKTVKKNKAAYTIKKLKKKKYFVQVRAYVEKDGAKVFGEWSKAKKVVLKK